MVLLSGSDWSIELRQPPVQDHDLAEVCQHHVVALQVAVDHAARMGVGDGVADGDEGAQQAEELQRIILAAQSLLVVRAGSRR